MLTRVAPEPLRGPAQEEIRPERHTAADAPAAHTTSASRWRMRLCWLAVVAMHGIVGAYFYAYAAMYWFLKHVDNVMGPMMALEPAVAYYYTPVRVASLAIAATHGLAVVYAVACSLLSRELVFALPVRQQTSRRLAFETARRMSLRVAALVRSALPSHLSTAWRALERTVAYDIDVVQASNAVEAALQIFQANKLSRLVARVWINRMMTAAVVANCWSFLIVHAWLRRRRGSCNGQHYGSRTEAFAKRFVDTVVDMVYGVAIPSAILYPYYSSVDMVNGTFPFEFYYMDTWSINILAEANQVLVTSNVDFASKMAPGVMLFYALWSLQSLTLSSDSGNTSNDVVPAPVKAPSNAPTKTEDTDKPPHSCDHKRSRANVWRRAIDTALFCAGILVLALHVHASVVASSSSDRGCLLELRRWGTRKYICVVLEVSCLQKRIAGTAAELDAPLANVEAQFLETLILSHCPSLAMPSRLQSFRALSVLKIHNSTIAEWSDSAALTASAQPLLLTLIVTLSTMSSVPPGLLSPTNPLEAIILCSTNLTAIPDDAAQSWQRVTGLLLDLSPGITEIPLALRQLPLLELSLAGNSIASIPADDSYFQEPITLFHLAFNPLNEVPLSVLAIPKLSVLDIRSTNISALPVLESDMSSRGSTSDGTSNYLVVMAANTPMCEQLERDASPVSANPEDADWFEYPGSNGAVIVGCNDFSSERASYPLTYELEWRAASRD